MIRLVEALIVFTLLSIFNVEAQVLNGKLLRLNPTALPTMCAIGDLRVDSGDSYKLKLCNALNTWDEIIPTGAIINPMTTAGDLIYGGASGTPTRLATSTGLLHAGTPPSWSLLVDADVSGSAAIAYPKLNLTGAILNADLAGSIEDSKLSTIATAGKVSNSATTAASANIASAIVARDGSGNFSAGTITAALTGNVTGNLTGDVTGNVSGSSGSTTGNAATATALAANPADCASDTYATTIAASGALTCASVTNASTTATAANTVSTIVLRDGSGNFSAGTISAALTGNSSTATALAANPTDCSANQFANTIAASGNLTCAQPAFTDISGVATIANGGTNNGSLAVTAGGTLYTDGSKIVNVGAGTSGYILTSQGASAPVWAANVATVTAYPPSTQTLTSGSTYEKDYTFTITSGSATVGATYTHNTVTYTVNYTVASGTLIVLHGNAAPLSSGTLTKASGTGDATLTFSAVASPVYLRVRMVGGGGGGAGGGVGGGGAGGAGGNTTFGTSLLTCNGGGAGQPTAQSTGGSATISSPAYGFTFTGSQSNGFSANGGGQYPGPQMGGSSPFGGAGGGNANGNGVAATANTGSGGGGGSASTTASTYAGGGGASGGYLEAFIPSPSATYGYAIGTAGSAGTAGSSGFVGGAGGTGLIIVEAHYQ